MNPNNYASLEASKRLVEAGIVLETEAGWYKIYRPGCHSFDMVLSLRSGNKKFYGDNFPAPSMAEVWRELPKGLLYESKWHRLYLSKCQGNEDSFTEYSYEDQAICGSVHRNTNPTDALINLLIWVRKEASHE
jgi:hypothetical protein